MTTADDQSVANLQRALRQPEPQGAFTVGDWIFDTAGDEVMVCGPQGKPGFKWLKPNEKSLEARLLYALVSTIIKERDAS